MNFKPSKEQEIIQNTVLKIRDTVILPPGKKRTGGQYSQEVWGGLAERIGT